MLPFVVEKIKRYQIRKNKIRFCCFQIDERYNSRIEETKTKNIMICWEERDFYFIFSSFYGNQTEHTVKPTKVKPRFMEQSL